MVQTHCSQQAAITSTVITDLTGFTRTHTFAKPGTANLTVAADASNPLSQTNRVNTTGNGALNTTLMAFSAKADTGDVYITSVTVRATSTINAPAVLYLYDTTATGAPIQSVSTASSSAQNLTFTISGDGVKVAKDTTKTFVVTGDFGTATYNGTVASTTVTSVTYRKPNGTLVTASTNVNGNDQYFYSVSPQWALVSATAASAGSNGTTGSTTGLTATFVLTVKPIGGTMILPATGDFGIAVASSTSANATTSADSVQVSGSPTVLAEGNTYTVTITKNLGQSSFTGLTNGTITSEWFTLNNASSSIATVPTNQTWGLSNFKTNPTSFVK
jgi:hypothetical protein